MYIRNYIGRRKFIQRQPNITKKWEKQKKNFRKFFEYILDTHSATKLHKVLTKKDKIETTILLKNADVKAKVLLGTKTLIDLFKIGK